MSLRKTMPCWASCVCGIVIAAMSTGLWAGPKKTPDATWNFVVSGDSRNCGDVVMPSIAAATHAHHSAFYWHLGDLRAIYDFDDDYHSLHPKGSIFEYEKSAWTDVEHSQIEPFGETPFFLGIGNHETFPPKTREEFTLTFADWLDSPVLREQRLRDDPQDHQVRPYYHWIRDGVDFITLDNATFDQFDEVQLNWLKAVLHRDVQDAGIRALVVGMHEALPPAASQAKFAKTLVYGYLMGTVSPPETSTEESIRFEFREVTEAMTPSDVVERYGSDLVHRCYQENAQRSQ